MNSVASVAQCSIPIATLFSATDCGSRTQCSSVARLSRKKLNVIFPQRPIRRQNEYRHNSATLATLFDLPHPNHLNSVASPHATLCYVATL